LRQKRAEKRPPKPSAGYDPTVPREREPLPTTHSATSALPVQRPERAIPRRLLVRRTFLSLLKSLFGQPDLAALSSENRQRRDSAQSKAPWAAQRTPLLGLAAVESGADVAAMHAALGRIPLHS
jgi:hypothetical protein